MKRSGIVVGLVVALFGAYVLYDLTNKPKTGYIILEEVFEGFDMKKELSGKFEKTKNARTKILDSMAVSLKLMARQIDSHGAKDQSQIDVYNYKREEYYQKSQQFEQDNAELTGQLDKEILTQLNQYVKDYGKENGYRYIFGNDGNGAIMYGDESDNLTKEMITYVNLKYKGVK